MEIYKDVKGFEGLYKVSNYGNIKSLERKEICKNILRIRGERILKPSLRRGYLFVTLSKNGQKKGVNIHKIVADHFLENIFNYPQIDHIDGDKENNNVENLRWVTAKQNSNNKNSPNTFLGKKINKGGKIVLQFDLDDNLINEWVTTMEIQRVLGYQRGNISNCCNGLVKTAYGFKWKYK